MLCKIFNANGQAVFLIAEAVTAIEPAPGGSAVRLPGHTIYLPGTPEEAKAAIEAAADEEAREEDRIAAAQRKVTAGRKGAASETD